MKKTIKKKVIAEAMVAARGNPCFICGGKPFYSGAFLPSDATARELNINPDATMGFVLGYTLCEECGGKSDTEQRILAEVKKQAGQIRESYHLALADPNNN